MGNSRYEPIDCNFHDILLDRATRRVPVFVEYHSDSGLQKKQAVIKDIFTKSKEEFLSLEDGETIRLDHLISVDGIPLPGQNACKLG